ncbi:MAG: cytochrome P450 [Legionellales bacterium]|nr:cytochrome P450 [Legionellales bacterium]
MPTAKPFPTVNLFNLMRMTYQNKADFIEKVTQRFGDIVQFSSFFDQNYIVNTESGIRHVLLDNQNNYTKEETHYQRLRYFFGQGLLTNEGESWKSQRHQLQPYFHSQQINHHAELVVQETRAHMEKWQDLAKKNKSFDMVPEMLTLALVIAGKVLYHVDLNQQADFIVRNIMILNRHIVNTAPFIPWWLPTYRNIRFRIALCHVQRTIREIITTRRSQPNSPATDLLHLALNAKQPDQVSPISEQHIFDEVLTLLVTGHESIGTHLIWTWLLLSQYPRVRIQLQAELKNVLNGQLPTITDLPNLVYLKAVIQESLRMYPPIWLISRKSIQADEIDGYYLPANSNVLMCPFLIQKHSQYWENPRQFIPERFLPDAKPKFSKHIYLPFGAGPRICIASQFSIAQIQLILATIAQHFEFEHLLDHPIVAESLVTYKPRELIMRAHYRHH